MVCLVREMREESAIRVRTAEKWIAESGATFHMTRSADYLRDMHPSEDKVKVGNDTLIGVEGYGSLTVVFLN